MDSRARTRWLWALAAAGLAARLFYIHATRSAPPHPDFDSFAGPALEMAHPYDTSFREPAFAWWLWLLHHLGVRAHAWVRAWNLLWFLPSFFLAAAVARKVIGERGAFLAAALYAFLPSQIHADGLALRHGMEAFGVTALVLTLLKSPGLEGRGPWGRAAGAAALLALIRVNHAAGAGFLLTFAALRARSWRPAAAVLPALLLLLPHLWNNQKKFGDPFQSVNRHSHWFDNLENIGRPGFPATFEEWQKSPYRGTRNFLDWRIKDRWPSLLKDLAAGTAKCLTIFHYKVYFSERLPAAITWVLLLLYGLGFFLCLAKPDGRLICAAIAAFSLPYALVVHVFWAGRFFVPLSPLILTSVSAGTLFLAERIPRLRRPTGPR